MTIRQNKYPFYLNVWQKLKKKWLEKLNIYSAMNDSVRIGHILTVIILFEIEFVCIISSYSKWTSPWIMVTFSLKSYRYVDQFVCKTKIMVSATNENINLKKKRRKNNGTGKCSTFMWRRCWRWQQRCKLTNYMHVLSWWLK